MKNSQSYSSQSLGILERDIKNGIAELEKYLKVNDKILCHSNTYFVFNKDQDKCFRYYSLKEETLLNEFRQIQSFSMLVFTNNFISNKLESLCFILDTELNPEATRLSQSNDQKSMEKRFAFLKETLGDKSGWYEYFDAVNAICKARNKLIENEDIAVQDCNSVLIFELVENTKVFFNNLITDTNRILNSSNFRTE